jgi:hypothetical protein
MEGCRDRRAFPTFFAPRGETKGTAPAPSLDGIIKRGDRHPEILPRESPAKPATPLRQDDKAVLESCPYVERSGLRSKATDRSVRSTCGQPQGLKPDSFFPRSVRHDWNVAPFPVSALWGRRLGISL